MSRTLGPQAVIGSIMHALVIEQTEVFNVFDGPPSERTKATKALQGGRRGFRPAPAAARRGEVLYRGAAKEVRHRLEGVLSGDHRTEVSLVRHDGGKDVLRARLDVLSEDQRRDHRLQVHRPQHQRMAVGLP